MKLYYAAGTCSLAAHIVACEVGITLELERVDIRKTLHMTASGVDFVQINPAGYVPLLQLDDGSLVKRLTWGLWRRENRYRTMVLAPDNPLHCSPVTARC